MDLGGVYVRVDVSGPKLLGVDGGDAERQRGKAGHSDAGSLHCQHLGDLFALKALGQRLAGGLEQLHVHAVIEKHVHPDDVALTDGGVLLDSFFQFIHMW